LVRGKEVRLSPKEFSLLSLLTRNPNLVYSREALLEHAWSKEIPSDDRTVDVHMRWLRSKIEVDPSCPALLLTVRGIGYKFVSR
jgi:DNA-binding response OmpR family regulator